MQKFLKQVPPSIKKIYSHELDAVYTHSSLMNQTSTSTLLRLQDVKPMMRMYNQLVKSNVPGSISPAQYVVQNVSTALQQSVSDSSRALRSLPVNKRTEEQKIFFEQLRDYSNQVAKSILEGFVEPTQVTLVKLFAVYEIVDPKGGAEFFTKLEKAQQDNNFTTPIALYDIGKAVQCLVKAKTPIDDIVNGVKSSCNNDLATASKWTLANLALVFLKYSEDEKAQAIFELIMTDSNPDPQVVSFLLDAFIGDAEYAVGLRVFNEFSSHEPNHLSMMRLLQRAYLAPATKDQQLELFESYLSRLTNPKEMSFKMVTTQLVANLLIDSTPESAMAAIRDISSIYEKYVSEHKVLLNIFLSEISQQKYKRYTADELVRLILDNYPQTDDVVSFRVRLNSLANVEDNSKLIEELWTSRLALDVPLSKLDWTALLRGSRNSKQFTSIWVEAQQPYAFDIHKLQQAYLKRVQS